ncbi:hypothetical protein [Pseudomonas sp. 58 R 12]|nr:hypothetical protein [Pseudomonas sp. 58 R 12]
MSRVYRYADTKKPATLRGRGLAVSAETGKHPASAKTLLQVHSIFVRGWLLLGQAMDITATQ